ncbi:MAG: SBBP repeat-containing protein, partial [Thermoplasmata archaeon]|nr:SBBP repeat-containing protein [Thermoplasmata archaeon]
MYNDAFVTKLNANGGSLVYSTYIGHLYDDVGIGIDVDKEGCVYVVGATTSGFFPTVPFWHYESESRLSQDSFILKLGISGHYLNYSKVLSASYGNAARAVAVDDEGCAYVIGSVIGGGFDMSSDAFQPLYLGGNGDAYVLKMDAVGDKVVYASYLGGNGKDYGNAVALDGNDTVFITGKTYSTNGFPTTPGVYDNTSDATTSGTPLGDAFLCRLDISYPYLVNDTGHFRATTGETYTFNLTIADNVGIVDHGLQYWFEGGNATTITMDLIEGDHSNGNWTATIDIPYDSIAPLYYRVWAIDAIGLNATVRNYSIPVVDNDLPFLENLTPATGGTGNEFNLSVRVWDNVGISRIKAIYSFGEL